MSDWDEIQLVFGYDLLSTGGGGCILAIKWLQEILEEELK